MRYKSNSLLPSVITSSTWRLTDSEQITRAETLLALNVVVSNWSCRSADDKAHSLDSTVCKDVTIRGVARNLIFLGGVV